VRADVAELPNRYSFAEIVTNAKSRGIKILGILDIWTMNWDWNFTLNDWEQAVTMSVARYKDDVDAWEIWNEPEYPSNPITAERYFAMLHVAYSIIKEHAPDSKVLMGGGLHLNTGGDPWLARDEAFAKRLSELGADQYADGISFHAYPWTNQVANWVWERYDESLDFYRSLFEKNLEVWITETGYPAQDEGETSQAAYLTEAVSFFGMRAVNAIFWYELRDTPYSNPTPTFGLLTDTLTPRPAYYSLQTLLTTGPQPPS
jgi:exo-beta-1,3-glucanase (GH17 family)